MALPGRGPPARSHVFPPSYDSACPISANWPERKSRHGENGSSVSSSAQFAYAESPPKDAFHVAPPSVDWKTPGPPTDCATGGLAKSCMQPLPTYSVSGLRGSMSSPVGRTADRPSVESIHVAPPS